jgi:hypothetical protein
MPDICIVHLVWKPLGLKPLRDFIASYKRNPGGVRHRLVVAFNGFDGEQELGPYREVLEGVPYEWFLVSPPTQDIPVYFETAKRFGDRYFCFLNSFSVILEDEWLAKMYRHVRREDVGVVGATGSWTSHHSWVSYEQGKPSIYADIMADLKDQPPARHKPHPVMFELSEGLKKKIHGLSVPRRLALELYYYGIVASYYRVVKSIAFYIQDRVEDRKRWRSFELSDYAPFPTPHLRTNAFMIRREVMLKLTRSEVLSKKEAHKFESGKESMTNQVLRMGLKVLVVGNDGRAYEQEEWPLSETVFQGEQRNLLVADNQTRDYASADAFRRTLLSRLAWGWEAAPSAPGHSEGESVS